MDNDFLQEMAAEVRGIAIKDQTLTYVEMVAENEDEPWYFWQEFMLLLNNFR